MQRVKNTITEVLTAIVIVIVVFAVILAAMTKKPAVREAEHQVTVDKPELVQIWPEHVAGFPPEATELVAAAKEPAEVETLQATFTDWAGEDFEILCHLVMAEAEGEPMEGKIAVVNVVLNRCRNRGKSIQEVVFTPNQFCTGPRFQRDYTAECWDAVVAALIDGERVIPDDVEYFCEASIDFPYLEEVMQIGQHKFWREVKK